MSTTPPPGGRVRMLSVPNADATSHSAHTSPAHANTTLQTFGMRAAQLARRNSSATDAYASSAATSASSSAASSAGDSLQSGPSSASIASSSIAGPPTRAITPPRLVRLLMSVWPLPMQSLSTYAILLGLMLLILVIIDEFVCHLASDEMRQAAAGALPTLPKSIADAARQAGFVPHLLRHSFLYRCFMCIGWIAANLLHGLFVHGQHRRRGGSRKRRSTSVTSSATLSDSDGSVSGGNVRRSVTFASEELSATGVGDLVPTARPLTKIRLRLFFGLALVLACCGIAFELAMFAHLPVSPPDLTAVSDKLNSTFFAFMQTVSLVSVLSVGARVLMVGLWCAFCLYCAYHLWYRKAIGTRKTNKGQARARVHTESEGEESDFYEDDESSDEELSSAAEGPDADQQVQPNPVALVSAPAIDGGAGAGSAPSSMHEASDDNTSDVSSSDSESDSEGSVVSRSSFAIPTAAQLLMFEKLDASLFFHPEQELNQYRRAYPQHSIITSTGQQSKSRSRPDGQQQQAPSSPPSVSLPLSSSSPLLHSTLYHLASTKFLADLSPTDFSNLSPELQWRHVAAGEVIYRRNDQYTSGHSRAEDAADGLFIIVSGTVGAVCPESTTREILATFHAGDSIGELEFLFARLPRALTMVALTAVQMLRIPTRLGRLWSAHPPQTHLPQTPDPPREEEIAASAYTHAHTLSSFSMDAGAMMLPAHSLESAPRSDLLLSFVRTTLARQWRSAEFILQQFFRLPLQLDAELRMGDTPAATPLSRYFALAFSGFYPLSSPLVRSLKARASCQLELSANSSLFDEGSYRSDQLFIVLEGSVWLSTTRDGEGVTSNGGLELGPGSVLNAVSYFTDTNHSHTVRAGSATARIAWLTRADLLVPSSDVLSLALAVCEVLAPTLAQFQSLGFERKWIRAGTLVFRESQPCDALYTISSGRVRIVTGKLKRTAARRRRSISASAQAPSSHSPSKPKQATDAAAHTHGGYDLSVFSERESYLPYQRTAAASSSSTSTRPRPNTAASKRVRFELARGELIGEVSFLNGVNESAGDDTSSASLPMTAHASSALCTKDTELIKISRSCFTRLIRTHPRVLLKISQILALRLKDLMTSNGAGASAQGGVDRRTSVLSIPRSPFLQTPTSTAGVAPCMSVCVLTASPGVDLHAFALRLSLSLSSMGRTMLLTPQHVDRVLGEGTCANLNSYYHRSLFTYWLSHVESQYAFCLLVADAAVSPWTMQCQRQADLTLIVANADDRPEDDLDVFDEDDDPEAEVRDNPVATAAAEARAADHKRRMRAKRVSKFEKLVVWNGGQRAVVRQQLKQQQKRRAESQMQSQSASTESQAHSLRPTPPSFSPTLHPSPVASTSSSTSSSSSSPVCAPRLHFSLRDLVLLHPASSQSPHGTRFWCAARPSLHRFHHVGVGCTEHFDRLARYVSGKTVGVVLSGGGARGLSHLGVLTSFAEQGVPIDYIGGTSQGSFMAALYAGQPYHHTTAIHQQMKARVHTLAETMGSIGQLLTDATFPVLSYFAGKRFGENISRILGQNTRIEDLWLPYFAVTTNLSQADMCVHDRGTLWKAVRASMTVLDYLPPMQISRSWPDLLIDGGYTNNLPVDVCHGLFQPCYVVAIDVENKSGEEKISRTSYYGPHLSGWWLLRTRLREWVQAGWMGAVTSWVRRITGQKPRKHQAPLNLPKFGELIGSLVYINHNRQLRSSFDDALIDLYIRPDLGTIALLDYGLEPQIVDIGYQSTKVRLTEWRIRNNKHLPKATQHASEDIASGGGIDANAGGTSAAGGGMGPPVLLRTSSNAALETAAQGATPTSLNGGGSGLTRRKNTPAHRGSTVSFLAPSTLTLTHDLSRTTTEGGSGAQSSPVQRSLLTGSPILHAASFTNLATEGGGWADFHLQAATGPREARQTAASGDASAPQAISPNPAASQSILANLHAESSASRAAVTSAVCDTAPAVSSSLLGSEVPSQSRSRSRDDLVLTELKTHNLPQPSHETGARTHNSDEE